MHRWNFLECDLEQDDTGGEAMATNKDLAVMYFYGGAVEQQ